MPVNPNDPLPEEPQDPADGFDLSGAPEAPAEPHKPAKPTGPTELTELTELTEPTEPTEPVGHVDPVGHGIDELPPDPFGPGDPFIVTEVPQAGASASSEAVDPMSSVLGGAFGSLLGPMLGNFAQMMAKQGPLPWDTVVQIAQSSVNGAGSGGSGGGTVNPLHRIRLEELVRIIEPHVVELGGLQVAGEKGFSIDAVTKDVWVAQFLAHHKSQFEKIAAAIAKTDAQEPSIVDRDEHDELMSGLMKMVGPSMLAMQLGAMAGHLGQRAFGNADLPLPLEVRADRLIFVTENIAKFADDWSLPIESIQLRIAVDEIVKHAVMRIPLVTKTLRTLTDQYASEVRIDTDSMSERLAGLVDPSQINELLAGTGAFGVSQTPALIRASQHLTRFVTLIEGWCNHVSELVARRMLGGDRRPDEALRRRRLEADPGTELLSALVGVHLDQALFDRGAAFIEGVFSRAGTDGLLELWTDSEHLPTNNELDAPGLWLARLDINQGL
jgi:putative hydrolase